MAEISYHTRSKAKLAWSNKRFTMFLGNDVKPMLTKQMLIEARRSTFRVCVQSLVQLLA